MMMIQTGVGRPTRALMTNSCGALGTAKHQAIVPRYAPVISQHVISIFVLPSSKSRDTKTRTDIKNPARINLEIFLYSLRISSHFPAAIENDGDRFSKWKNL